MKNNNLVSVIIPVYNEEDDIEKCLESLKNQSLNSIEIIVVDDGSTDGTIEVIKNFPIKLLRQLHNGPGEARNMGAKTAKGNILVFVDADMTFDKNFIKDLINPIVKGKTIGTFSKNEMNANKDKLLSRFWNINRSWSIDKLIPENYPSTAPVFRAILKSEFNKVGGFDTGGAYTDDWSLSRKLGKKATLAKGAVYYHKNPDNFREVWKQARWIGKSEFIAGSLVRKLRSLVYYSFFVSLAIGLFKSQFKAKGDLRFLIFRIYYDSAIWLSVFLSFFKEAKYK